MAQTNACACCDLCFAPFDIVCIQHCLHGFRLFSTKCTQQTLASMAFQRKTELSWRRTVLDRCHDVLMETPKELQSSLIGFPLQNAVIFTKQTRNSLRPLSPKATKSSVVSISVQTSKPASKKPFRNRISYSEHSRTRNLSSLTSVSDIKLVLFRSARGVQTVNQSDLSVWLDLLWPGRLLGS